MVLSIEAYDTAEEEVRRTLGYTECAAFGTKTFDDHGFPTRMIHEDQLFRYIDRYDNHDLMRLEPGQFYRDASLETNYSVDEVELLTRIANAVADITEKSCGRKIDLLFNHQGSIGIFRVIQAISNITNKNPLKIFEVGPGCGYSGAMMAIQGHRYMSYDVTQGYYLWQNRLFEKLFGYEFTEFAANPDADYKSRERVAHIPWWEYSAFHRDCPEQADVVVSNANLGEMHIDSLKYVLRISQRMLADSDIAFLVFANVGSCHASSNLTINFEIERAGYELILKENVFAYVPKGKGADADIVATLEDHIPLHDPTGLGKTVGVKDFVNFGRGELIDEFRFNAFIHDWRSFG